MPGKEGPLLTIDDVFEAGDRVVSRLMMSGVQSGTFINFAPTGKSTICLESPSFRNGKVVVRWSCTDRLKQLTQLGMIRLP